MSTDRVRRTVEELVAGSERLRLVAAGIGDVAGGLQVDADAEALRRVAAQVQAQAMSLLAGAARMANRAERLDVMADLKDDEGGGGR